MHYRHYLYLSAVAVAALAVVCVAVRNADALTRPTRRRTALELSVLGAILLVGVTAILRNQMMGLGKATLIFRSSANDTNDQYIPFYLSVIRHVRNGAFPLWDGNFGMGASFLGNQSWLMDPFNLVLVPLCLWRGEGFLSQALAITFACRAVASGLLFSHLLTRYCRVPLARIFGAATYGLGGYLFTEGQHYFFGTVWVFVPIVLVALEWLMDQPGARAFLLSSVAVAALVCFSAYLAFVTLLFIPLYVALRLAVVCDGTPRGTYLRRLGVCALAVFCGCLVGGIMLMPAALYITSETGRVGGERATEARGPLGMLASHVSLREFKLMLSRMLGNGLISCGTNYRYVDLGGLNELEFFQGGMSCGVFVLLGQFAHWVVTDGTRRQRVAVALAAALIAFYCLNYFPPSIISVFHYPTYRGGQLVYVAIICAMSVAVEKRLVERHPAPVPLALSLLLTAIVLAWSWMHTVNAQLDCAFYALAFLALVVSLAFLKRPAPDTPKLAVAICAIMVSTVVADSFCELNLNPRNVSPQAFPMSGRSDKGLETREALDYLAGIDDSWYRVDRNFATWNKWNDALSFGYRSVTSYNAAEDGDVTEFFHRLWPEAITSVKSNFSTYAYLADVDNPRMMALTGIRYVITPKPFELEHEWAHLLTVTEHGAHVYGVSYGSTEISPLYLRSSVLSQTQAEQMELAELREALDTALIVDDEAAAGLPSSGKVVPKQSTDLREAPDGSISGTVESSRDAVACLTVPYTEGWTVSVDGQQVPTFHANYGFVGFQVPAGTHAIEAHYLPAGIATGAIVSMVGVLLSCAGAALARRWSDWGVEDGDTPTSTAQHAA